MQVLASKTKIYMVLEYVNGGELFDKIVSKLYLLINLYTLNTLFYMAMNSHFISKLRLKTCIVSDTCVSV